MLNEQLSLLREPKGSSVGSLLALVLCVIASFMVLQHPQYGWDASSSATNLRVVPRVPTSPVAVSGAAQGVRFAGAAPLRAESGSAVVDVKNPRSFGFALALDEGTRQSHSVAENSAFVTGFFKGIANRESFARLVASLYFVYEAMEEAFDQTQDPTVKSLDYPQLRRVASLEEDMAYYYGPDWRSSVSPSPATKRYVQRIKEVAVSDPQLLIAHQYTRYLGDLFGGQMMSGMAVRSLKLDKDKGVSFYKFREIKNPKDFISEWYTKLNDLGIPADEQERIVDEANLVFRFNIEIFEELDGNAASSMFRLAWGSFMDLFKRK